MTTEHDHRNERNLSFARHPYRAVFQFFDFQRTAHRRLREDTDEFPCAGRRDGGLERYRSIVPVDGNVFHSAHQGSRYRMSKHRILRHEANESAPPPIRRHTSEREIQIARVIQREHRPTLQRDVLLTNNVEFHSEDGEDSFEPLHDDPIQRFSHPMTVRLVRPTSK